MINISHYFSLVEDENKICSTERGKLKKIYSLILSKGKDYVPKVRGNTNCSYQLLRTMCQTICEIISEPHNISWQAINCIFQIRKMILKELNILPKVTEII